MANTYTQMNVHCVFAVKGRENIIVKDFRDNLHKYISTCLKNLGCYPLAVGGWKDHVHVFFELPATQKVSDAMREIKSVSSKWINDNKFITGKFQWQDGYGAFTYSRSQRSDVIHYIINQEEHHRSKTFKEEYLEMLHKFEVPYQEEYLFEFYNT